jgi:hypothetical protein
MKKQYKINDSNKYVIRKHIIINSYKIIILLIQ